MVTSVVDILNQTVTLSSGNTSVTLKGDDIEVAVTWLLVGLQELKEKREDNYGEN